MVVVVVVAVVIVVVFLVFDVVVVCFVFLQCHCRPPLINVALNRRCPLIIRYITFNRSIARAHFLL